MLSGLGARGVPRPGLGGPAQPANPQADVCVPLQAVLREELGADRDVLASMLLLEPSAVVEGCAHDLQKRVTRLVEVRTPACCGA